jgi:restriction endonuclease Mrr
LYWRPSLSETSSADRNSYQYTGGGIKNKEYKIDGEELVTLLNT